MKTSTKTKTQLIDEINALRLRIVELQTNGRETGQVPPDFDERMGRYFPQENHTNYSIYVIFDRKYEFINDQFSEMFGVTPAEVCRREFDPMNLVAPESRNFIQEKYRKGFQGEFSAQSYEFTGMTRDGARIECETFVLFIPYKWGVAIHGMLRNISVPKRINEGLERHRSDLRLVRSTTPALGWAATATPFVPLSLTGRQGT